MASIVSGIVHKGSLITTTHGSCLGSVPSMFFQIPAEDSHTRRVFISTTLNQKAATAYLRAYRKAFPEGITFRYKERRENGVTIPAYERTVQAPTVTFHKYDSNRSGGNKEFGAICRQNASSAYNSDNYGYFSLLIPKGVRNSEVFALIKIPTKAVSYVSYPASKAILKALELSKGCFKTAICVTSLANFTGAYFWPISRSRYTKDEVKEVLSSPKFIINNGVFKEDCELCNFGDPVPPKPANTPTYSTRYRGITTATICWPGFGNGGVGNTRLIDGTINGVDNVHKALMKALEA